MLDPFNSQKMEMNMIHPTPANNADLTSEISKVAGTAAEFTTGVKHPHKNGVWVNEGGDEFWYKNGKLHREDGPAVEWVDGVKFWFQNDKRHSVDGPAVEWPDGWKEWYINDRQLTEQEFNELAKDDDTKNGLAVDGNGCKKWCKDGKCHREDGPAIEWPDGSKFWYKDDKPHREDGPADEWANGDKFWYLNGVHHREGGPAKEYANGSKFWYKNGKRHREDGPATEYVGGVKCWYLDGERLNEEEFNKLTGSSKVKNGMEIDGDGNRFWYKDDLLHRENGPAVEANNGYKAWYTNGKRHREDGPAAEWPNGVKYWYKNDKRHREDGPAVEWPNGDKDWYLDDKQCSEEEYVKRGEMKINLSVKIPAIEFVKSPDGDWKLLDNKKLNTIATTHILMYLQHRRDKGVLNKDLDSYIFKYIVDKNLFKSESSEQFGFYYNYAQFIKDFKVTLYQSVNDSETISFAVDNFPFRFTTNGVMFTAVSATGVVFSAASTTDDFVITAKSGLVSSLSCFGEAVYKLGCDAYAKEHTLPEVFVTETNQGHLPPNKAMGGEADTKFSDDLYENALKALGSF